MTKQEIERINQLARLSKTTTLSPTMLAEQTKLRKKYIDQVKSNLRSTLDNVVVQDQSGECTPLKKS